MIENEAKKLSCTDKGIDIVKSNLHDDLFDDEDDLPLIQRSQNEFLTEPCSKRKRGRPRKSDAHPYTCKYCSKVLHTAKGLKTHLRVHTGEKMKHCLFCDARYTRTNHLMRHVVSHDKPGVKHPCEHCDKMFEAAADLFKHSKMHDESELEKVILGQEKNIEESPDIVQPVEIDVTVNDVKMTIIEDQTTENLEEASFEQNEIIEDSAVDEDFLLGDGFDESDDNDDIGFNKEDDQQSEVKKMKKSNKDDLECTVCHKVLSTPRGLKMHMRKHIGPTAKHCKVNVELK